MQIKLMQVLIILSLIEVESEGFEPPAYSLQTNRSSKLNYDPVVGWTERK